MGAMMRRCLFVAILATCAPSAYAPAGSVSASTKCPERVADRRRRSQRRPRRLRRARQDSEHRRACRSRRALRSRLLPVPALQSQPIVVPDRPASELDRRSGQPRARAADVSAPPRETARGRHAAAIVQEQRLRGRAHRQALSLRRAGRHRHVEPGRLSLVGLDHQSTRTRSRGARPHHDDRPAGQLWRDAQLAGRRRAGCGADRWHCRERGRPAAGALREREASLFPGCGLLSPAHAVRRAQAGTSISNDANRSDVAPTQR